MNAVITSVRLATTGVFSGSYLYGWKQQVPKLQADGYEDPTSFRSGTVTSDTVFSNPAFEINNSHVVVGTNVLMKERGYINDMLCFEFLKTSLDVFGASGTGHKIGLVPDPGSSAGSTKFLREDATWAIPAASGSITHGSVNTSTAGSSYAISAMSTWEDTGLSFALAAGATYLISGKVSGSAAVVAQTNATEMKFRLYDVTAGAYVPDSVCILCSLADSTRAPSGWDEDRTIGFSVIYTAGGSAPTLRLEAWKSTTDSPTDWIVTSISFDETNPASGTNITFIKLS